MATRVKSSQILDGSIVASDLHSAIAISTTAAGSFASLTANGGVVVDNITIDGTTLALSSGDLTLDVAGDIILDADGGDFKFRDGGAGFFTISNSSLDTVLKVIQSNEDFIIRGNDNGNEITALTLDMANAGRATFNENVIINGNLTVEGTRTLLNVATLDVEDKNITLNYHASNDTSASAGGAGITIQDAVNASTDASILWDASGDKFTFSHSLSVGSTVNIVTSGSSLFPSLKIDNNGFLGSASVTDALQFQTSGDLQAKTKIGIGIDPVEILDIKSVSGDARIRLDAPSGSDTEIKFFNAGAAQYTIGHDDATDNFVIGSADVDTPLVSVKKSGNVGIGTNDPTYRLDVLEATGNGLRIKAGDQLTDVALSVGSAGTADKFVVKAGGNVGIGTASPQKSLHVVTNSSTTNDTVDVVRIVAQSTGTPLVGFGPTIEFRAERGGATADSVGRLGFVSDVMTASRVDGAFVIETAIDGAFTERLKINSLGVATFSGTVTVDHEAGGVHSNLRIDKGETGSGKLSFHNSGTQLSYISLDAAEDMYYYGASGVDQIFYTHGALALTLTSGASTFVGTVTANSGLTVGNSNIGSNSSHLANLTINNNAHIGTTYNSAAIQIATTGNVTFKAPDLNLTADNARLVIEETDGTDISYLGDHTGAGQGALFLYNHGGTATVKLTADSHANYINNGNKFGIGTATPQADLHVEGTALLKEAMLKEIAKDISITVVDVFVYDTSRDSDGGAWRKRTQHTSWYNESLNTAIRGPRKEFPAVAIIAIQNTKLYIYDGDDPDMPMWMVFDSNLKDILGGASASGGAWFESVEALNGELFVASVSGHSPYLFETNFISEKGRMTDNSNEYCYYGNIEQRNDGLGMYIDNSGGIAFLYTRGVTAKALPNSPIDIATGLPMPTVAVSTGRGVSIKHTDGRIVDLAWSTDVFNHVAFTKDNSLIASGVGWYGIGSIPQVDTDFNAGWTGKTGVRPFASYNDGSSDLMLVGGATISGVTGGERRGIATDAGLTLLRESKVEPTAGAVAHITKDYNTGWMIGDTKLALSSTDATNPAGAELVTNGTFGSNTSGWAGTSGASISLVSNTMEVTGVGYGSQGITTVVGKVYVVSYDYIRVGGINGKLYIGTANNNGNIVSTGALSSSGSYATTFTAVGTTTFLNFRTDSSGDTRWDNISARLAESDRSYNDKGIQVFGTVTKTAVATGTDLVGYSGFDGSKYLYQPYNSTLNFGTGNFAYTFWHSCLASGSDRLWLSHGKYNTAGSGLNVLQLNSSGSGDQAQFYIGNSGQGAIAVQGVEGRGYQQWVVTRKSGVFYVYRNGKLEGSIVNSGNVNLSSQSIKGLYLGAGYTGSSVFAYGAGSLALIRISADAPTEKQIKEMYEDEKHLFIPGAQSTFYGTSNAVVAIDQDDSTEILHVGTSSGRSDFQGLRRVNNTTTAVGAALSAHDGLVIEE